MPNPPLEPEPSDAFEIFWDFAVERQRVYHQRVAGLPGPWTDDHTIAHHRFTNAYRAADRVSQYLINRVIYEPGRDYGPRDTIARVLAFRLFNRIDTWTAVTDRIGETDAEAVIGGDVADALDHIAPNGPIYNAAYIMPPPLGFDGPKYRRHLAVLTDMLLDSVHERIGEARSLQQVYETLRGYPSIGPFLAFQFTIDLNYSVHLDFDEDDFVAAGPGALRGLVKCFNGPIRHRAADLIRWTAEQQHTELSQRAGWQDLWGRRLRLIDVQNLFCEVDKYLRVARPDLSAGVPGSRIKQRYVPAGDVPGPAFPPKWGLDVRPGTPLPA